MFIRFKRGGTEANTAVTLGAGELGVDLETKSLHFHDGESPGGYVATEREQAWIPPPYSGPGSQILIAGDEQAGFFGEVPGIDLITSSALATQLKLTAGNGKSGAIIPWLKYIYRGKILFVARSTVRYAISWNSINAVGAVDGSAIVTVKGDTYRVRLLKGVNTDPGNNVNGSEWNNLIYPVFINDPMDRDWANYTASNLGLSGTQGNLTWCQEISSSDPKWRVLRGGGNGTSLTLFEPTETLSALGWRPVLELVL